MLNNAKLRKRARRRLMRRATALAKGLPHDKQDAMLDGLDDGWEGIRQAVIRLGSERGEWAGYPLPVEDAKLVIEPRHPLYATLNGATFTEQTAAESMAASLAKATGDTVVNWWRNQRGWEVYLLRNADGKTRAQVVPANPSSARLSLALQTLGASRAWSVRAEFAAMERLKTLVTPVAFRYYLLVGCFLETSQRSKVTYLFRKGRPTVALSFARGFGRPLAALCLHPIGYYEGSFAGSMVPTDDLIAHLVMMRGDERRFWAKCNQHQLRIPEAGV